MLIRMLILASFLSVLIALLIIVLEIVSRFSRGVSVTMFAVFIAVEIKIFFLAGLLCSFDKFFNQELDLSRLVVVDIEV